MGLTIRERQAVTAQLATKYRQAGKKKKKGEMLDHFVELTGYNRKYAILLLQNWGKRRVVQIDGELIEIVVGSVRKRKRKPREKIYGSREKKALKKVWIIFDCPCGKRFVPVLRIMLPILENFGEIELDEPTRANLQRISAATIDRLLNVSFGEWEKIPRLKAKTLVCLGNLAIFVSCERAATAGSSPE